MLGLWRQERSASGLPARPGAVGPGGPAPIVLKVIPWKHPFEKADDDDSQYDIHTRGSMLPTRADTRHDTRIMQHTERDDRPTPRPLCTSLAEEVDRRNPHRGVEPRCLAEAGGK